MSPASPSVQTDSSRKVQVATWSELKDREPAYALVADVARPTAPDARRTGSRRLSTLVARTTRVARAIYSAAHLAPPDPPASVHATRTPRARRSVEKEALRDDDNTFLHSERHTPLFRTKQRELTHAM